MQPEKIIYLDHAAATPVSEPVLRSMEPYQTDFFYNPSSPYLPAVKVRRDYDAAKQRIAAVIGGKADDLIMTAGATESINLAMTVADGAHVVSTEIEHHAVLRSVQAMRHTLVSPDSRGIISPESIAKALTPETKMVSVGLANNEIGSIQPLRKIADIVSAERQSRLRAGINVPLWLHTDASQCAGVVDLNLARLGVDMMTLNAAKCYGPKQVGLLWRRPGVDLQPISLGGGQEMGLRSGTENVAGTIGFAVAIERAERKRKSENVRLAEMRDYMQAKLTQEFKDIVISGHPKKRLPGFLHVAFPGIDGERMIFALESRGVLLATGSACAANSGLRSHVLTAIGMEDSVADGSLRISLGLTNSQSDIEKATSILIDEVSKEKQRLSR